MNLRLYERDEEAIGAIRQMLEDQGHRPVKTDAVRFALAQTLKRIKSGEIGGGA